MSSFRLGFQLITSIFLLVRGQNRQSFWSWVCLIRNWLLRLLCQATVLNSEENFAVVFAAMGTTFEEAEFFMNDFREIKYWPPLSSLSIGNDPAIERIATPRIALTAAEYLAYEKTCTFSIQGQIWRTIRGLARSIRCCREVPGRRGCPVSCTNLSTCKSVTR